LQATQQENSDMDQLGNDTGFFKSPTNGEFTGQYFTNDDNSVKVAAVTMSSDVKSVEVVRQAMNEYKWNDEDFLLATYPKNGTHFMWEIMMMLIRESAEYIKDSKAVCMMDLFPVTKSNEIIPPPRVLNTHYRIDVLPKHFAGKKTVLVLRNPKDTVVSFYFHTKKLAPLMEVDEKTKEEIMAKMTFSAFLRGFLFDKDQPYGRYFDYVEYMWSLRDDPNLLLVYFEDIKREPARIIQEVNEFMGLNRSPELVKEIAEATNFATMKEGKWESSKRMMEHVKQMKKGKGETPSEKEVSPEIPHSIYRKGDIGDWKNHFTVADNELFDAFLDRWAVGKDIPFRY